MAYKLKTSKQQSRKNSGINFKLIPMKTNKLILSLSIPVLAIALHTLIFSTTSLFAENNAAEKNAKAVNDDEPYLVKTFQLDGKGTLNVKTSGGSIEVESHNGNEVRVEMYVKNNSWSWFGKEDEVQEILEKEYNIDISKVGNAVSATADRKSKRWDSNSVSIAFKVMVPAAISCNLQTSGGSISLAGVEGQQSVHTSGGGIDLKNITGDMEAKTSGGGIKIEDFRGVLSAHTSGGSINMEDAEGDLRVTTSGGSIRLSDIAGSIEARTSGGSIEAEIKVLKDLLTLKTSGGSIRATIPEGLGLDLDLHGNRVNTVLNNFSGTSDDNSIKGSINGGGIPVTMHTSGGSVTLSYFGQASNR
jgi:hypothetical protein